MKINIKIREEVEIKTVEVKAFIEYSEDANINGVEDINGNLTPCKIGNYWCPVIDIDSGVIINWNQGVTAKIHYKVRDGFSCTLKDPSNKEIVSYEGYVPKFMCQNEHGFGDYIIMEIDEKGQIKDWDNTYFEGFIEMEFSK